MSRTLTVTRWFFYASDGHNESAQGTFDVLETFDGPLIASDVYADYLALLRNHQPAFTALPDVTVVNDNVTAYYVVVANILSGPVDERWQNLTVSAASSAPGLLPPPTVTYTNRQTTARVTFQPVTNTAGTATVTVTVQDSGGTANGGVNQRARAFVVTVLTNAPPVVSAGTNQNLFLPNTSLLLNGSASDDGLPVGSSLTVIGWSKVIGPGTVEFFPTNAASTFVAFATNGTYTLRLTATDGVLTNYDEVEIQVYPPNQPPVINAWVTNSLVTVSNTVNVFATAPDDNLPLGGSVTSLWSVADGPGAVTFDDATALNTTAMFTNAGTYALRLTAGDGEFTVSRSVLVSARVAGSVPFLILTNFTNPTNLVVQRPMIQLQGYSTDALATLSLEQLDGDGRLARHDGSVVDRVYVPFVTNYIPVVMEGVTNYVPMRAPVGRFTTNYFQLYDVALQPGTNQLIVRASDGTNTMTTNYTVVFDTNDTTAPVTGITWPAAGASLIGTNFTATGTVDDFTAQVTATWNSQTYTAIVGRDGRWWLKDLPLPPGTNTLHLTAVDWNGNPSTNGVTFRRSAVEVSEIYVDPETLWNQRVWLFGVISNWTGSGLMVNGVTVTNVDEFGNFYVEVPPGAGGVAEFVVVAAGSGGSSFSSEAEGGELKLVVEKPGKILAWAQMQRGSHDTRNVYIDGAPTGIKDLTVHEWEHTTVEEEYEFTLTMAGSLIWPDGTNAGTTNVSFFVKDYNWVICRTGTDGDYCETNPEPYILEQFSVNLIGQFRSEIHGYAEQVPNPVPNLRPMGHPEDPQWWPQWRRSATPTELGLEEWWQAEAEAHWELGGAGQPGGRRLYALHVEVVDKDVPRQMDPGEFTVLGQHPDTNGWVYLTGVPGQVLNVTPTAAGANLGWRITETKVFELKIYANGTELKWDAKTEDIPEFCAGQKIHFTYTLVDSESLPIDWSQSVRLWTFSQKFINKIIPREPAKSNIYTNEVEEHYKADPDIWYLEGGNPEAEQKNAALNLHLYFNSGQDVALKTVGKIKIYMPKALYLTNITTVRLRFS